MMLALAKKKKNCTIAHWFTCRQVSLGWKSWWTPNETFHPQDSYRQKQNSVREKVWVGRKNKTLL